MAVDPDDIEAIVRQVAAMYRDAEQHLAKLVADQLALGMDGPTWAPDRIAAVGALRRSAQVILDGLTAAGGEALRAAVAAAWRLGTGAALADLPGALFGDSVIGEAAKAALKTVTLTGPVEALAAALVRDVTEVTQAVHRVVIDVYRAVIAGAVTRMSTSNVTRRAAAQQAWQGLVDRGVTSFVDKSGRRWQLSSYVEMATRTVAARAAIQAQTDRLDKLGVDLVYVSNSPQECALCRPYEGQVLALQGAAGPRVVEHATRDGVMLTVNVVATLVEARALGLFHPNCRHSISAYLPGVTRLPAQPTADPIGDEARQRQRAIERAIRKWKLRKDTAFTPDAARFAGAKVRFWQGQIRDHLNDHPQLKRLPYRESPGAGNQPSPGKPVNPAPAYWPPEPETDPGPAAPVVPPPPPPMPGDATLAQLLDVHDDLTDEVLLGRLATPGEGTDEERAEWAAAVERFAELAEAGERDGKFAKGHAKYTAKLQATPPTDLTKFVRRRLGQLKTDEQRAATLRAWWLELARRADNRPPGMRHGQRWRANDPAVRWAMAEMPLPTLSDYERTALKAYTGSDYSFINNWLRRFGAEPANMLRWTRLVEHIDTAFAKSELQEPLIVHRGVGRSFASTLGADVDSPDTMQALIGTVITEPGYISSSIGATAAFNREVHLMIRIPQGYQAINAMHFSVYGTAEREILVRRDAHFVVHAAYKRAGVWYIEAEIVPDDWVPGADWTPDPYGDAWEGYV